ncbi:MAG TPA: hypothetical protein VI365_31145, partial [Trebonia sp.]
ISAAARYGIAACAAIIIAIGLAAGQGGAARAQSPSFGNRFSDYHPGGPVPTTVGKVVEGLGMGACSYSLSSVEQDTVSDIEHGYVTATEITPQVGCGTISQYETWIHDLISYVENPSTDTGNPSNYWAGIMLDEELGTAFGYDSANYEALNIVTGNDLNADAPGVSWYFTEDPPEDWDVSTYYAIISGSWPAPQIYNTSDVDTTNTTCSRYGECTNLVTVWATGPNAGFTSDSNVTGMINGSAWGTDLWGGAYWVNNFS